METPPAAEDSATADLGLHLVLFAATCVTTVWAGHLAFGSFRGGVGFGGALMLILLCHEMGHYVVARRHGLLVSLPYFVPLPPQFSLGTLGAIIRMQRPIADRNQLIDVGAAGPLAGLVVAIPVLAVGLSWSEVGPVDPGAYLEGNSLLYIGLKYAVLGQYLPSDGMDVKLHPVAFAGWVGLLLTMINLIPIGQLDGGHVACGLLGSRHEETSSTLHRAMIAVAGAVMMFLAYEATAAGLGARDALMHGARGSLPWLVWAGIMLVMWRLSGGSYHPPIGREPLAPGRRRLVWLMALVFLAIFTPVPMRPVV